MSWGREPPASDALPQTEAEFRALYEVDWPAQDDYGLLSDEDASELHAYSGPPPMSPQRRGRIKRLRS